MFRLLPHGLPKDPEYPTTLQELGYFINDEDEIRSIENPKYYFKYFINRNERYNERQRESMNTAIRAIVSTRLAAEGMRTHLLPLHSPPTSPHIPILASTHIGTAPRTILLLGDSTQDLGILALRIIGGHSGVNVGSAVDFVRYVHGQVLPGGEEERPAVLLANCGQLRWNRRQARAMTRLSWESLPRESAVHDAPLYDPAVNTVEENRDQKAHIGYILSTAVPALCMEGGKLGVIAIADSARYVCEVLDENWGELGGRMDSLALVFPFHDRKVYTDPGFRRWLEERGRGYMMSESPAGMGLFGPDGGKQAWQWGYGVNMYGLPVEAAEESVFPRHFKGVVEWMGEVAVDREYVNETIVAVDVEVEKDEREEWGGEMVGAEIWETEAGRAQLRGDGVEREIAGEAKVVEKGSVDGIREKIEGVNVGEVEAQEVKDEAEKDTVGPRNENIKDDIAHSNNDAATQSEKETTPKHPIFSYDGAADERPTTTTSTSSTDSTSIPPERMERLPSYVETDEGEPQVKLSKEEKAAILQITVLSSPVRGKGVDGGADVEEGERGEVGEN